MKKEILEQSTNNELVEQIHYEFDAAADNILFEAEDILKDNHQDQLDDKAKRLKSMGFSAAKGVSTAGQYKIDRKKAQENTELIEYYKEHYPLNKFINEDVVKKICEKYGIVKGPVHLYIGEVPDQNLKEIERFEIKHEDALYGDKPYEEHLENIRFWDSFYKDQLERRKNGELDYEPTPHKPAKINDKLQIVAPLKDFDPECHKWLVNGYDINQKIKDPVVLHPCKGGYLILTAWGEEASDDLVRNEIYN